MAIPAYYSLLHRGSSGPDVALVQTWLNGVRDACTWHDPLKADGRFGLSTENAVKEFQLKNKMNVDGKVGATPGTCCTPSTPPSMASMCPTPVFPSAVEPPGAPCGWCSRS